jgi:hypothetical protein
MVMGAEVAAEEFEFDVDVLVAAGLDLNFGVA